MSGCTRLILHADDLGFTHGFNDAIRDAHQRGALTSTCLQVTGFAYQEAVREVLPACPNLGVGIHLNLVECRSILPHRLIPALTHADGTFRGYGPLLRGMWDNSIRLQMREECRAQIEKALEDGVAPDHLNSHRHAHMLPGFFEIACELAAEFEIPVVRIVEERIHRPRPMRGGGYLLRDANAAKMVLMNWLARRNRPKLTSFGLRASNAFVGLSYTAYGSREALSAAITANGRPAGWAGDWTIEALFHLCTPRHPGDARIAMPKTVLKYCNSAWRDREMQALRAVSELCLEEGRTVLANFRNLNSLQTCSFPSQMPMDAVRQYAV